MASSMQNGKVTPQLNQHSTRKLNLTVLQRIDCHIEEILTTAAHVTFYKFNIDLSQWSRKDVEGSLFVVKRRTPPRFQFIVMNRRSTENLVEDLLSDFEYEVQMPYLLYRNNTQEVNGIWFYDSRECEDVANLFSRILNAYSKVPMKSANIFPPQSNEFQELEAVPTAATMEGPLEPIVGAASSVGESSVEHLDRFFSNSMNLGTSDLTSVETRTYPSSLWTSSATSPILAPISVQSSSKSVPLTLPVRPITTDNLDFPNVSRTTLLKPSFFIPPPLPPSTPLPPPTMPSTPPLQTSLGTPLLQSFPPPNPPASLTPSFIPSREPAITRECVRGAFARLVQNEHFIDMLYREIAVLKSRDS